MESISKLKQRVASSDSRNGSLRAVKSEKSIFIRLSTNSYLYVSVSNAEEEIGTNGFGYDPIFYSTEAQKPMGLIDDYSKDLISHRGKAFRKLIALLMPIEKNIGS